MPRLPVTPASADRATLETRYLAHVGWTAVDDILFPRVGKPAPLHVHAATLLGLMTLEQLAAGLAAERGQALVLAYRTLDPDAPAARVIRDKAGADRVVIAAGDAPSQAEQTTRAMAEHLVMHTAAVGAVTADDLLLRWTEEEIEAHLPAAKRIARRMGRDRHVGADVDAHAAELAA